MTRWAYILPLLAVLDLALVAMVEIGTDLFRISDLLIPALMSLAVVLLACALGWVLTQDHRKTALIALLLTLAFGTLGDAVGAIVTARVPWPIGEDVALTGLYVLALAGPILAIHRGSLSLARWCERAALTLSLLLAVTVVRLVRMATAESPIAVEPRIAVTGTRPNRSPDIYLIVLDQYTATRTLRDRYGLDERLFEAWLSNRGFIVPDKSRANYPITFLALSSMLNLDYLDDYPTRYGRLNTEQAESYGEIENNRLVAFLRTQGYETVFVPSAFWATRRNRYVDLQVPDPAELRPAYLIAWYRNSALPIFHRLGCRILGCTVSRYPYEPETAATQDAKFLQIAGLAPADRPRFVFAHLLLPHPPYLYQADCTHRPGIWPELEPGADRAESWSAYLAQVHCTNLKLQELVAAIQRRASVPPVILLQGDHGYADLEPGVPELDSVPDELVAERLAPFAAYSLPGLPVDSVPSTTSPVNVLRLVLRHYLGADLPPVQDVSYWSPSNRPYDFVQVCPPAVARAFRAANTVNRRCPT